jgi:hypothetical protein
MVERKSGWSREFDQPIALPGGNKLVTLRDAANYITGLPDDESVLPELIKPAIALCRRRALDAEWLPGLQEHQQGRRVGLEALMPKISDALPACGP